MSRLNVHSAIRSSINNMDEFNTKYNLDMKKSLEEKYGRTLKEIDNSALCRRLVDVFICKCGNSISPSTLRFYEFDVTKLVCFECKRWSKQNNEFCWFEENGSVCGKKLTEGNSKYNPGQFVLTCPVHGKVRYFYKKKAGLEANSKLELGVDLQAENYGGQPSVSTPSPMIGGEES